MSAAGLSPMLATAGPLPPEDGRWAHEVKWDGARALVTVGDGAARLRSRADNDVTASYPELAAVGLGGRSAVLDGEVVVLDARGRPDFGLLQRRMHVRRPSPALRAEVPVVLLLFDVLALDDALLLQAPWSERRALLEELAAGPLVGAAVPPVFASDGAALLRSTREQGLEGVVSKRTDSRYLPGRRTELWVKTKNVRHQSAVVIGWKPGDGGRSGELGSLLLAVGHGGDLVFAGHVGTGFTAAVRADLARRLEPAPAAPCPVPAAAAALARWVRPVLVVEVAFSGWTREGRMRHPSYRGLREDLLPADVEREELP